MWGKAKIVLVKGNHESKNLNAPKELLIKHGTETFFVTHNPANRPDDWKGWMIHGHCHNKNLEKYPLVNGVNKTINVSCELLDYKPVRFEYLVKDLAKIKYWKAIKEKPVYL